MTPQQRAELRSDLAVWRAAAGGSDIPVGPDEVAWLLDRADAADRAEADLAALRQEVGAAITVARSTAHPGHDGPCSSGLLHPADVGRRPDPVVRAVCPRCGRPRGAASNRCGICS